MFIVILSEYHEHMKISFYITILIVAASFVIGSDASALFVQQIPADCDVTPEHEWCQELCHYEPEYFWWCTQEPERDPVIIIPGFSASQNKNVLYKDEEGGEWKFALFFNVYKTLIVKLKNNGYVEGEDLFIAHYDWRQSNAESAHEYLLPIIEEAKENTNASNVDIVAHSMGGLVAGAYIQSDEYGDDVDQFITLGTPHAGAANAYVAWEGGEYPLTWKSGIRFRLNVVEEALKKVHNQQDLPRPASIRQFFPSVRELLPIGSFIQRDGESVARSDMAEQNPFLQGLYDAFGSIFGVDVTTIAGSNSETIESINLFSGRTKEDRRLDRWRDGHPNPDPPQTNTSEGDSTVLLSSAHVGESNITLDGVQHSKLPNRATDRIIELLGLNEVVVEEFEYVVPTSIFGITILSPLDAVIEGPGGLILSKDQNDFGVDIAEYDDDPNDPDDPKVITIGNPPEGEYVITYTGTGSGEYDVITSYADEDETVSSVKHGSTTLGAVAVESVVIGGGSVSIVDDYDVEGLLSQLIAIVKQQKKDKEFWGGDERHIKKPAEKALKEFQRYEKDVEKELQKKKGKHGDKSDKHLKKYYKELEKLEKGLHKVSEHSDVSELLSILEKIKMYSPAL